MRKSINNKNATQYVIYCRVSTSKQGLGLEAQESICRDYVKMNKGVVKEVIAEKVSGKIDGRQGLHRAIAICREYGASLIVARLDRLSRHNRFLLTFKEEMETANISWVVANDPDISGDILKLSIMGAMAEKERQNISDKTKIALAERKRQGVKLGGSHLCSDGITSTQKMINAAAIANREYANQRASEHCHSIMALRKAGVTLTAIADALNKDNKRTARGALFTAKTVQRILERCGYMDAE